jgi:hypothetical protein
MTTSDADLTIRMSTAADTVAVVPQLVGFRPERSLVAISLRPPKGRVGLTMRYDLPPEIHDAAIAEDVATRLAHDGAMRAVLVCYPGDSVDDGELPRRALIEEIRRELDERDIEMPDALCVDDGRWWSYFCSDPGCCPSEGTVIEEQQGPALALAAEHALRGEAVLPDRESLAVSIAPVPFLARRAMEQALDRVDGEMFAELMAHGVEQVRVDTSALVRELVTRYLDPRTAEVSDDEAARVILGLADIHARDDVLMDAAALGDPRDEGGALDDVDVDDAEAVGVRADLTGPPLTAYLALFHQLARRALPPDDTPTCTVLAWLAYLRGNGGLANVALDRAFASEPTYTMAGIIAESMARQVPPADVRRAMSEAARDLRDWGSD